MSDTPCNEALTGMPGDEINYSSAAGLSIWGIIRTAGWQPAPKGGKIWTYETLDGDLVENTRVMKINKTEFKAGTQDLQVFLKAGEALKKAKDALKELVKLDVIDPSICAVTTLLLDGKEENLVMAKKLIDLRIQDLEALEMLK